MLLYIILPLTTVISRSGVQYCIIIGMLILYCTREFWCVCCSDIIVITPASMSPGDYSQSYVVCLFFSIYKCIYKLVI